MPQDPYAGIVDLRGNPVSSGFGAGIVNHIDQVYFSSQSAQHPRQLTFAAVARNDNRYAHGLHA
jgi:hypothetical protein